VDKLKDYFRNDRFAMHSGIELLEVEPGTAVARMAIKDMHMNAVDSVMGGAIFTLADFAFAAASNSYGTVAVAVNVSITYLKARRTGVLTARATEVARGRRIASYTVRVTDEAEELVALFQGTAYCKDDPIPALAEGD
jgi:acyl-CoA thioesterase